MVQTMSKKIDFQVTGFTQKWMAAAAVALVTMFAADIHRNGWTLESSDHWCVFTPNDPVPFLENGYNFVSKEKLLEHGLPNGTVVKHKSYFFGCP